MRVEPDPLLQSLRAAVRVRLRGASDETSWAALRKVNALSLDAPVQAGGMGLGLAASCAIAEELGRAALPGRYLAYAMAIDVAPEDLLDKLIAGEIPVSVKGFDVTVGDVVLRLDGQADPISRARLRQAAYLLGHAHGALACGVRYASQRKQFGQELRDFQGIGFRLAHAHVSLEALRVIVAQAITLADTEQHYGRQAIEALALAAETASEVAHVAMQVCGVRGMTAELAIHKHYVRIRREATRLGRPGDLWRAAGRARLAATS